MMLPAGSRSLQRVAVRVAICCSVLQSTTPRKKERKDTKIRNKKRISRRWVLEREEREEEEDGKRAVCSHTLFNYDLSKKIVCANSCVW